MTKLIAHCFKGNGLPYVVIVTALIIQHLPIFNISIHWSVWIFSALLAGVIATRKWAVFHLALALVLWQTLPYMLPESVLRISAIKLLIIFLVSTLLTMFIRPARASLQWFRKGRIDRFSLAVMAATALVSAIALVLWANWTDNLGTGASIIQQLPDYPEALVLLLGIPAFAILNAFSEEVIYRGVYQQAVQTSFDNAFIAICIQAAAFAALHFVSGFPNGAAGYAMTLAYGAVVGYMRYRTGGILAPFVVHITSDLVIVYYLFFRFV